MRAIIDQLKYWRSLSDREDSKAKFAFWACSVMFGIVFFSFFVLAGRSPFSLLVPGLSFPWPGIDHRVKVEMFLPVQRSYEFAPTPKLLDMEIPQDERYRQRLFNRLLDILAEGRSLKQPGEEFHPSDDLILELLPGIHPRAVWEHNDKVFVDLHARVLQKNSAADLYKLFHSLRLTLENNPQLSAAFGSQKIIYRINGGSLKSALADLSEERQERYRKALSWPPKDPRPPKTKGKGKGKGQDQSENQDQGKGKGQPPANGQNGNI